MPNVILRRVYFVMKNSEENFAKQSLRVIREIREVKIHVYAQTANVNLYHMTKFSPYFSFTVYCFYTKINRGYYTVARRYEFYFRAAKQYFTNERSE